MKEVRGQHTKRTGEAKRALSRAALEIIAESGFTGLTLARVGESAGYSRGLTQYHFGSKEGLITELFEQATRGGQKMLKAATDEGLASILAGIDSYNELRKSDPLVLQGYWFLTAQMGHSGNPKVRQQLIDYQQSIRKSFATALVHEGVPQKEVESLALFLLASMRGLIQQSLAGDLSDKVIDNSFGNLKQAITCLVNDAKTIK
jgi:AcrR family transcriptional regulator